ncbi:MAG: ClbS/DfsB family four-helix bundle protein [Chryseobacterium sp.]|jgi:hypothetical protein|uniref:ClbS/DfsB family four-helix bundle protein n=1 Tax=Chryseobacterium sp. TaxID=1871047 RepID=UPI00281A7D04|nr:ClbS/DfsB family four-helix bundle protein [Chryseobacterium sp.]MDR2238338.1 ClbS/DfsB family four-helix bundle protein [Chryseobacterium sp.]
MQEYKNKTDLITELRNRYQLYDLEFDDIKEEEKNLIKTGIDKNPSQNLSYQLGWTALLLQWEADEQKGLEVKTPAAGYKWNNLKGLYESFYEKYGSYTLQQQRDLLKKQVEEIILWVENMDDKSLFVPEQRKWATTPAKWPVWKWIHINTVAPFKNFRAQIRKWKKEAVVN